MPYVVSQLFSFGRTTPLVSVSENGRDSPLVYAYTDILDSYAGNSSFKPSHIIQIDGKDATDFLLDWSQYGTAQDKDALWNDVFYSLAQVSLGEEGSGTGTFTGNSLGRFVYPGPTTTLTFANGSQTTTENFARVLVPLSGIVEGADMYQEFLSPPFEAYRNALDVLHDEDDEDDDNDTRVSYQARHICPHCHTKVDKLLSPQRPTPTTPAVGYPASVIRQKQNLNGGYFLGEPGLEDVAVLTVSSFYPQGEKNEQDFQKINSDFIAAALAANKTKLIIDVSANGGGNPFQSFDLFKQLFPSIHPYGASRMRAHESIDWLGKLYSAPVNQSNSDSPSLDEKSFWDYHTDLDSDNRPFSSWKQKYGPHPKGPANDTFTSLIRFNLNDKDIREYSDGIWVTGYGSRSNITHQPFRPQNIVLVTDGACGSACAFFAEFLQQEAGVQTIALGGRPSAHPMQGIGGVRGGHVFSWELIFRTVAEAALLADPVLQQDLNQTALARYSLLPAARGTGSVNFRDVIRRNDDEQTPLQFLYEPAQCRIFYTKSMVIDQSVVWKTVADTVWGQGTFCIASDNSFPGTQRNLTAESEAGRQEIWSVRPDFDIKEAWEGLKVETGRNWYGAIGEHAMVR